MQYDIVSVVASARGIPALRDLLSHLPSTFDTPILCLADARDWLVKDLQSHTRLKVRWAEPGVKMEAGHVYVSKPGTSIVCTSEGELSIAPYGPESSSLNPVDQYLTSVAACYGARALCLVLAGFDRDGEEGAAELKKAHGTVLVLDRATAAYWGMAEPIIRAGHADRVLTIVEVAEALRGCFTSQDLLRCAEIQVELRALMDTALRISGTRMGHMQRMGGDGLLRIIVQRGFGVELLERFDRMPPDDHSATGRAARTGRRVIVEDVLVDPHYAPLRDAAIESGFRSVQATPLLLAPEQLVGVLATHFTQPHVVSAGEARNLDEIGREAAQAMARIPC